MTCSYTRPTIVFQPPSPVLEEPYEGASPKARSLISKLAEEKNAAIQQSNKIRQEMDIGHAILESYSRILEILAHKVMSLIEDVMHADNLVQNSSGDLKRNSLKDSASRAFGKFPNAKEEMEKN